MKILKQVTLDRASRKKDRSISLTFITTLEQSTPEFAAIDELLNDEGILFFKSNGELNAEELKALESVEVENEGKSKSQRLRNVLFIKWKQHTEKELTTLDFNQFYAVEMEKKISEEKNKLDNEA